jgi:hypothetical protein
MFHDFLKTGLSIILFITALIPAAAQYASSGIDTIYGSDPLLFNGRQYIYQIPPGSSGNPFLSGPHFQKGWITIAERQYQHLDLNYDIVNQVLLLKYIDQSGYTMVIEVSESWLTSFGIGTSEFEFIRKNDKPLIYQVFNSENVNVRYYWQKELKLENVMTNAAYAFSGPRKTSLLVIHGTEYEYKKNRDFVKAFDPASQTYISKYLKNNKIKVNNASDASMRALVNFCNTLINQ